MTSDAGRSVPTGYREVFAALEADGVLAGDLASRLAGAAGLRNLIAHRYGVIDLRRIHAIASTQLDDLLAFCEAMARGSDSAP